MLPYLVVKDLLKRKRKVKGRKCFFHVCMRVMERERERERENDGTFLMWEATDLQSRTS